MEENKKQETTDQVRGAGLIIIAGAFVLGCIIGKTSANQLIVDSYRKGVSDTLNSIVFKQQ